MKLVTLKLVTYVVNARILVKPVKEVKLIVNPVNLQILEFLKLTVIVK